MAKAQSLGVCVRCINRHPATTVQTISFGDSSYNLALCEKQADNLLRDLIGWSRCGTIVESHDAAVYKPKQEPVRQRGGVVEASHMHIPTLVAEPELVDETEPAPLPTQRRPLFDTSLPVNHDRWVWTDHAIQRARLRQVSSDDALWCAEHPDTVRPGDQPGTVIHIRGSIKLVVNPATYEIITVADRRDADDEEKDLQNAS